MALTDGIEHLAFHAAEACFAIPLKDLRDAAARCLFDHSISIDKAVTQAFGQGPSGAGLAAAHHSHQDRGFARLSRCLRVGVESAMTRNRH